LTAITSSVAGANGLAVDGVVSEDEFARFASNVVTTSGLGALAYADLIDGEDRTAWERDVGVEVRDTDGAGGFLPAGDRAVHAVVRHVEPVTDESIAVIGFDLLSDPIRADGAAQADGDTQAVLVGPITLATGGSNGLFLVFAVRDAEDRVIGYLAAGFSIDPIEAAVAALPGVDRVAVAIDGEFVGESRGGDATESFELAGREFTVAASDRRQVEWLLPLTLAVSAALLSVLAVLAERRRRRSRRSRELFQERVQLLSDFARSLTTVRSSAEVSSCVERLVPPLLDVEQAVLTTEVDTAGARRYRIVDSGAVALALRIGDRQWSPIEDTLADTVADLIGGALTRTRLADEEQAVLNRFQHTLLTPPPTIDGFDVAVGYRSALETVGIGGDWHTVIDTPAAVYLVIGDVAGHGPGAVALMAEVKTVMRHVLSTGTPLDEALRQADLTLQRRSAYASACVIRVDKRSHTLEYVSAGHVPPVLLSAGGQTMLSDVHRPWLGVETSEQLPITVVAFGPGDALVAYTDGLVEERGELIDTSIANRFEGVMATMSADDLVARLVAERERHRTDQSVDDDIAVIAIRRMAPRRALVIAAAADHASIAARDHEPVEPVEP
jgi:serine phosphatase RsbU (regulator of sigma subunit)